MEVKQKIDLADIITLSLGFCLFLAGLGGLFFYQADQEVAMGQEGIGHTAEVSNNVRRKYRGSLAWFHVPVDAPLFDGDEIVTAADSHAYIKFKDGTSLFIPQNSLVRVNKTSEALNVGLVRGSVELKIAENSVAPIRVNTERGSETFTREDREVRIYNLQDETFIERQDSSLQRMESGPSRDLAQEETRPVPQILIPHNAQSFNPLVTEHIPFKVEEVFEDHLLIISKGLNSAPILQVSPEQVEGTLGALAPGDYFIAYVPINDRRLSAVARVHRFNVQSIAPPDLSHLENRSFSLRWGAELALIREASPNKGHEIHLVTPSGERRRLLARENPGIQIHESGVYRMRARIHHEHAQWSEWIRFNSQLETYLMPTAESVRQQGILPVNKSLNFRLAIEDKRKVASEYRFFVYRQDDLSRPFKQETTDKKEFPLNINSPGHYIWFAADHSDQGLNQLSVQDIMERKMGEVIVGQQVASSPEKEMRKIVMERRNIDVQIPFELSEVQGRGPVKMQIYKDQEMTQLVLEERRALRRSPAQVKLPELGTYYWRIVPDGPSRGPASFTPSDLYRLIVDLPPMIQRITEIPRVIMRYMEVQGREAYRISLPEKPHASQYKLEIYRSPSAQGSPIFQEETQSNEFTWMTTGQGEFFYRYKIIDKWGRESEYSPLGRIYFPISPLTRFE